MQITMAFTGALILVVTSLSRLTSTDCFEHIVVNSKVGNDTACMQNETWPCESLKPLNDSLSSSKDIWVEIETDITLEGLVHVKHARNLTICGSKYSRVKISCSKNAGVAGFLFHNISRLVFSNLELYKCGREYDKRFFHYTAAMLCCNSSSIRIENVVYSHCSHTALALLDCYDSVDIQHVNFSQNGVNSTRHRTLAYAYPAAISIEKSRNIIPMNYSITNCSFDKNVSPNTNPDYTSRKKYGRGLGGALGIIINADQRKTMDNNVLVSNCTFSGNKGKWGGAVYALIRNKVSRNSIHIHSSYFVGNVATAGGGGVAFSYLFVHCSRNVFTVTDCVFESNHALYGGGLAIFSEYFREHCKASNSNNVTVVNSKWMNNTGFLAAAVDIATADPFNKISGFLPVPIFRNCTFAENKLIESRNSDSRQSTPFSSGVFVSALFQVQFESNISFKGNYYTALSVLSGSIRLMNSTVEFDGNRGYRGGAVALYSFSSLLIGSNSTLYFTNNHALIEGGGIYYNSLDQKNYMNSSKNCFIRSIRDAKNSSAVVIFKNNSAVFGGKSVYSDTFKQCYNFCFRNHTEGEISRNNTFSCIGNFTFDEDDHVENSFALVSSGERFQLNESDSLEYSGIPGKSLQLPLIVLDEFSHKRRQLIFIDSEEERVGGKGSISIKNPFAMSNMSDPSGSKRQLSYVLSDGIYPIGKPNACANFTARMFGFRACSFTFSITLLDCPPGFYFNQTCECSTGRSGYGVVLKCSYHTFQAYVKAGYWIGYIPENSTRPEELYYATCTETKCKRVHLLPGSSNTLDRHVCRNDRTGILCGKCAPNSSVYFNSREFRCGQNTRCKYGLLLYFLAEVLPMVIFFLIVVTFDVSFTSGGMTGFILFCQHISPLEIRATQDVFQYLQTPYRLLYGLFNFEYFGIEQLSFCLYKDFQVLDIITFKYVTIMIAFGLVLILITVLRHRACNRMFHLRRRISTKTSVVNGLSAFLVICYAQCTKTSFYILKYSIPVGYNGKQGTYYTYYGSLVYFSPQHLIYAVPALFTFIVITTLPPLILFLHPLSLQLLSLCRLSEHWVVNKTLHLTGINKLMPLIDCFQGCYKNRLRFFAGLYFFYRVAIWITYLQIAQSDDFRLYSLSVLLLIFGVHSISRPYKKRSHNVIDSFILLDLVLINICSLLASSVRAKKENSYQYVSGNFVLFTCCLQLVLIYLPIVVVLCRVGKRVCSRLRFKFSAGQRGEEMHENDSFNQNRESISVCYGSIIQH